MDEIGPFSWPVTKKQLGYTVCSFEMEVCSFFLTSPRTSSTTRGSFVILLFCEQWNLHIFHNFFQYFFFLNYIPSVMVTWHTNWSLRIFCYNSIIVSLLVDGCLFLVSSGVFEVVCLDLLS